MTLLERVRQALAPSFRVERELGKGGMGTVFLAHDPTLDWWVAIKVLQPEGATAIAVERFLREARLLARLRHPNIIQIHQAGDAGGLLYFVMDYAAGETLVTRLRRGPLTVEEGMVVAVDVLDALAAAHRLGIIHRDVKPGNVFLVEGRAYLADFGIAKTLGGSDSEPGLTIPGRQIGTPGSMAPEQAVGLPVTAASDIYATGLLLYECFSGRRWPAMQAPQNGDWSGIPPRVALALRKALAFDRDQRWATADAFRAALVGKTTAPRWKIAAALGAIAILGFVAGLIFWPQAQAAEQPVLEIADFVVANPADRAVADQLAMAIADNLSGAPDFDVRRGADRKRSVFRLTGRLSRHQDSLLVNAVLTAGNSQQRLPPVAALDGQQDELANAVANDLLLRVMRHDHVWVPFKALPENSAGLMRWLQAERLYFRAQWDSAAHLYVEAERLYPDCILCAYRYNDVQRWLEQTPDPARVSRVRRDIDSFPPHYQALIRAELVSLPARIDTLRAIAEDQYRDFSEAWYRFGEEVFHRGPLYGMDRMDALPLLWRATGSDTSFQPPLFDIATLLISEGDSAGAARARAHLFRFEGSGVTAARQALAGIAFEMRFGGGPSAGVEIARQALQRPGVADVAEVPAGPRLLHVFGLPEGAVALGEAFEQFYPQFARSGLVAQITGHAARGQLDAMRAAASRLQARGTTPHLAHYPKLLELALLLFDDSLPEGYRSRVDSVVAPLARPGIEPATDRWAAAWMLAVLAYRQRDASRAQRYARILDDEPPPGVRGRFLTAWMSAARGDFRQALVVSHLLTADSVIVLNEAYDDLFLRAALKLSRAEWQAGMQNWDEVRGDLRWHKHWQMTDRPVADPKSAETDWALGTLARWRFTTWFDKEGGEPAHELCRSLFDVARNWAEGDSPYRERAERAHVRFRTLGCSGRP